LSLSDIFLSVLLHLIPIFALLFFYPFIRKPLWRRLYVRLALCFTAFWFGYFVLPVLLFGVNAPSEVPFDLSTVYNPLLSALGYYLTVFLNLVAIFIRSVLFVMPFAFFFAPVISLIILWVYLRGEKGTFREKVNEISYRYEAGTLHKVKERLLENAWKEEKELFKLMIVFLPISLYVLTLVLTAFNLELISSSPLIGIDPQVGVFIEDLVAYLASFLAAVYLLYSSKLGFRGRSLGDKIRFSVDRFILTTGTVLALFSILAFVVQFQQYLIGLFYFVIHYLMMAVIFSILLPLFEPFGSLVLIKSISAIGRFKPGERLKSIFNRRTSFALVSGLVVASAVFLIHILISGVLIVLGPSHYYDIPLIKSSGYNVPFGDELLFMRLFMVFSFKDIFELVVAAAILVWLVRQLSAPLFRTVLSTAIFSSVYFLISGEAVAANLISTGLSYYWVTGVPAAMTAPGFYLPASRLGTLLVLGPLMTGGAALFMSLSPMFLLLFLAYLLRYWRNPLLLSKDVEEENIVEKAYSSLASMPSLAELRRTPGGFAFKYEQAKKSGVSAESLTPETRDDIDRIVGRLSKGGFANLSVLVEATKLKEKRAYEILEYLVANRVVGVYELEVDSVTYKAAPQSLFVTTSEGLDLFNYTFGSLKIDPALISGMLTAIISFVKEATKSRQFLRTIEHGDVVLVVEYGKRVFGTIVTDQETPDLRMKLRKFLDKYEAKHADILAKFTGQIPDAEKDKKLAESIFGQP
jgi:hypothetical protein